MDASVWVGAIFGLVGTGVGGGLSVWSSIVAQRQQAIHQREDRRQALATSAVEAALAELFQIQRAARRAIPEEEAQAAARLLHERVLNVQIVMQRVPDAELRDRVREDTLLMPLSPPGDTRTRQERRVDIMLLCADAIACLGAYLRSEALPLRVERVGAIRALWPFSDMGSDQETFIYEGEDES